MTKDGSFQDLNPEFMSDFEEVQDRVDRHDNMIRVLQLIIKDIPRKNKEDDPHYKPYAEFFKEVEEQRLEKARQRGLSNEADHLTEEQVKNL
mmetsp:Transcript_32837/g.50168  ORF Transcript_32837/g.50168 Transcript_32837/m.50168 type:complete len:92 (-) Transcript_32837:1173-1448(-)